MKTEQLNNTASTKLSTSELELVVGGRWAPRPISPKDMKAEAHRPANLTRLF